MPRKQTRRARTREGIDVLSGPNPLFGLARHGGGSSLHRLAPSLCTMDCQHSAGLVAVLVKFAIPCECIGMNGDFAGFETKLLSEQRIDRLLTRGENKMSNYYAVVSAVIFALVALGHLVRLIKGWTVEIGPYSVSMTVSWVGLVVAALIAIWGFMQLG